MCAFLQISQCRQIQLCEQDDECQCRGAQVPNEMLEALQLKLQHAEEASAALQKDLDAVTDALQEEGKK